MDSCQPIIPGGNAIFLIINQPVDILVMLTPVMHHTDPT
ncbi:hypothetical protein ADIARSV_0948 [Arcticibacter svalbardensis MN12-7]|uniref:Uncharacterized protein n=1 Tax=Arcticibacter svalbardensis MN12-7 TaxID=1150600 RepID=R9GVW1_9SPHI|nr:hypothetical protein ADIARSV_0948 [Arcticibacter svalbardensis MN12-7]